MSTKPVSKGKKPRKDTSKYIILKELSADALEYRGPVRTAADMEQEDLHTTAFSAEFNLASSVGSQIQFVLTSDPSTLVSDWASLAASFEESRTLAIELAFYPSNRYNKTTTTTRPILLLVDRNNGGVIGNYNAGSTHVSARIKSLEDPWKITAKMQGADEAQWTSTSGPTARYWIKTYADGLSASTEYGLCIATYRVQFRGRA